MKPYDLPDANGHFGPYGGIFVSETLMHALEALKDAYEHYCKDPSFIAEFQTELKHLSDGQVRFITQETGANDLAVLRSTLNVRI